MFSNDEVTSLRRRLAELTESRSIFDQNFIQLTEALENSKKQVATSFSLAALAI